MEWSEYLNTQQETYLDSENNADNEVVYKNDNYTVCAHKSLHAGENDYYFAGSDEDFAIIRNNDGKEYLCYDCTLSEIINEITEGKNNETMRQKAIDYVNNMSAEELDGLLVEAHEYRTHKWMEVYPNGNVYETEEPDNLTRHYIKYPTKEVANIYDIRQERGESCGCEICSMYRDFKDMDKEEFVDSYSEEDWNYCNKYEREDAIIYYEHDNDSCGEDIRKHMLSAIDQIYYGYFDDED